MKKITSCSSDHRPAAQKQRKDSPLETVWKTAPQNEIQHPKYCKAQTGFQGLVI